MVVDCKTLEQEIADSFIRTKAVSNLIAKELAALAVSHVVRMQTQNSLRVPVNPATREAIEKANLMAAGLIDTEQLD